MISKSKDIINDVVLKINKFQSGEIQPITTGVSHLDDKLLGGLRPSDVVCICAPPFNGKTYFADKITSHIETNYKDVIVIKCLWEIELFKQVITQFAKKTGKPVKEIINNLPDEHTKKQYADVLQGYRRDGVYIQDEPVTPKIFEIDISSIIELHKDDKIVVIIDNIENVLLNGKDQKTVMDDLIRTINLLKKQHPYITFIVLNQFNRNIQERVDNPKNHFPREGDMYGSAALFKLSDVVLALIIPNRLGIDERYGVVSNKRYTYINDTFKVMTKGKTFSFNPNGNLFYHYLKYRNVEETFDMDDLYVESIFTVPDIPEKQQDNYFDF